MSGGTGNQTKNRDHPNYRTVVISHNTEKNPRDLRRLAAHSDFSERPTANFMKYSQAGWGS